MLASGPMSPSGLLSLLPWLHKQVSEFRSQRLAGVLRALRPRWFPSLMFPTAVRPTPPARNAALEQLGATVPLLTKLWHPPQNIVMLKALVLNRLCRLALQSPSPLGLRLGPGVIRQLLERPLKCLHKVPVAGAWKFLVHRLH